MPKSKVRKKADAPIKRESIGGTSRAAYTPSPTWYPIVMVAVLIIGLAYIVVYYLAGGKVPVMQDIGAWNFAVGFGFLLLGLTMGVRWR